MVFVIFLWGGVQGSDLKAPPRGSLPAWLCFFYVEGTHHDINQAVVKAVM